MKESFALDFLRLSEVLPLVYLLDKSQVVETEDLNVGNRTATKTLACAQTKLNSG